MSAFSTACKTVHMSPSPSSREHTCESVGLIFSQGGFLTHDQGQMLDTELDLMETGFIQARMDMQAAALDGPDGRSHSDRVMTTDAPGSTVVLPFFTAQVNDLSTTTDEHNLVMPGEKTPSSYGEVPGFVLAIIGDDHSQTEPPANIDMSSLKRTYSAARVCLEKSFNSMCADTPKQQDDQAAGLSNYFAEAQDAHKHPEKQKSMKTDRTNAFETSSSYVAGLHNSFTNMCGQVIGHIPQMVDPKMHQSLIKSFSLKMCPGTVLAKAHRTPSSNTMDKQQSMKRKNEIPTLAAEEEKKARKRVQCCVPLRERRETHNSKERERRRRIRLFCDELNTLVPFCDLTTDKVTTLKWTTTFLKHINKMHGDTVKEEFEKLFRDKKDLKSNPEQEQIHQEMAETLSILRAVE